MKAPSINELFVQQAQAEKEVIDSMIKSLSDPSAVGNKKLAAIKKLMRTKKISLGQAWSEYNKKNDIGDVGDGTMTNPDQEK